MNFDYQLIQFMHLCLFERKIVFLYVTTICHVNFLATFNLFGPSSSIFIHLFKKNMSFPRYVMTTIIVLQLTWLISNFMQLDTININKSLNVSYPKTYVKI